jgi:hypothetical protein
MAPNELTKALITTLELLADISILPLLLLIRILQYFFPHAPLPEFTEDAEGNLIPVPKPTLPPSWLAKHRSFFDKRWTALKKWKIIAPIAQRWSRIVIITFLIIYAVFACAVMEKSLVWFVPWLVGHYQNAEYKREHKALWWNELLLHIAGLMVTCMPLCGCIGLGVAFLYYSRKVFKYERFQKGMVRKPGGRGYYMPDDKKQERGNGKGNGAQRTKAPTERIVPLERVHIGTAEQPDLDLELRKRTVERLEASPQGYEGEVLVDPTQVLPAVVQPPKPAAKKFQSHAHTQKEIQAIWTGWNEKSKGGYDGRDVRKKNFEEDMEMEMERRERRKRGIVQARSSN